MNRHFLLSALFIVSLSALSFGQGYQVQSKYFVYLQTEPAQPFNIKINGQQLSANASGYLILPQLKDGDYKLAVNFPGNKNPEQVFNFKIDSKDKGYLIKDYGADGWGLFDLQTMQVQHALKGDAAKMDVAKESPRRRKKEKTPDPPPPAKEAASVVKEEPPIVKQEKQAVIKQEEQAVVKQEEQPTIKQEEKPAAQQAPPQPPVAAEGVTDFTRVLSQAAKDPSLLEKPKKEPIEEEIAEQPAVEENDVAANTPDNPPVEEGNGGAVGQGEKGVILVYDDRNESGKKDPVTIFIPEPKKSGKKKKEKREKDNVETPAAPVAVENNPPTETLPQPVEKDDAQLTSEKAPVAAKNDADFEVKEMPPIPQEGKKENLISKPSHCKNVATEDDFFKLRRAMAAEMNDDNMIGQAKKAFKDKCYTTAQVKYLSSMFLSNAGKYNFYEAAYQHTSDKENFASLSSEIREEAYKQKFDALLQ